MRRTKVPVKYTQIDCKPDGYINKGYTLVQLRRLEQQPYIYFLMNQGTVVYIGASTQMDIRIRPHFHSDKIFDAIALLPTKNYQELEPEFITQYQPLYNVQHNPRIRRRDYEAQRAYLQQRDSKGRLLTGSYYDVTPQPNPDTQ